MKQLHTPPPTQSFQSPNNRFPSQTGVPLLRTLQEVCYSRDFMVNTWVIEAWNKLDSYPAMIEACGRDCRYWRYHTEAVSIYRYTSSSTFLPGTCGALPVFFTCTMLCLCYIITQVSLLYNHRARLALLRFIQHHSFSPISLNYLSYFIWVFPKTFISNASKLGFFYNNNLWYIISFIWIFQQVIGRWIYLSITYKSGKNKYIYITFV